jgi:IPT/TIG domain
MRSCCGRFVLLSLLCAALIATIGCGGGNSRATAGLAPVALATPSVTLVTPDHMAQGSGDSTLIVDGTGFTAISVVRFNGINKQTSFVSSVRLTATIIAADLLQQGLFSVDVVTPGASNASNAAAFRVGSGLPAITSITPGSVIVGSTLPVTVTVSGSNFHSDSSVLVDLAAHPTTFVSSTQLTFVLMPAELVTARQVAIEVLNGGAGGGQSAPQNLTVANRVPSLISITPDSTPAGTQLLTVAITGNSFARDAVVMAGSEKATSVSFQDSSHLSALFDISRSSLPLLPGTSQITVVNPPPDGGPSNALVFTTARVTPSFDNVSQSVDAAGQPVSLPDVPTLSGDGRYLAFSNQSATFSSFDVTLYRRDLCNAVVNCTPTTFQPIMGAHPVLSGFGRYLVFDDAAALDTFANPAIVHVELRDTCAAGPTGCITLDVPVAISDTGFASGSFQNIQSGVTPDGRFVAFRSNDTSLVHDGFDTVGLGSTFDIFRRDTCIGAAPTCTPSTVRISTPAQARDGLFSTVSTGAAMSDNGRFVAFSSDAPDLMSPVPSGARPGSQRAYLRDTCTGAGASCTPHTEPVALAPDGTPYPLSSSGSIDATGRYVVFRFVVGPQEAGIAVRDSCFGATGVCVPSTVELLRVVSTQVGEIFDPIAASADMRFVVFASDMNTIVANDTDGLRDVFVLDTCIGAASGCTNEVVRVSVTSAGIQAGGFSPAISRDGRSIAFVTFPRNGYIDQARQFVTVIRNPMIP